MQWMVWNWNCLANNRILLLLYTRMSYVCTSTCTGGWRCWAATSEKKQQHPMNACIWARIKNGWATVPCQQKKVVSKFLCDTMLMHRYVCVHVYVCDMECANNVFPSSFGSILSYVSFSPNALVDALRADIRDYYNDSEKCRIID